MANYDEFTLPFRQTWWLVAIFCLAVVAFVSFVELFLPQKLFILSNCVCFSIGICCYFQELFFNGGMKTSANDHIVFSKNLSIINLCVWILLVGSIILVLNFVASRKTWSNVNKIISFISLFFFSIQSVGFVSAIPKLNKDDFNKTGYFSTNGEFELSANENVIVFLLDTCSGQITESTLKQYPDLFDGLNGFTYYPDMTTTYSRTYPSVIYLLTRYPCYFDKPHIEYAEEAQKNGILLPRMKKSGVDIRLFTEPIYLGRPSIGIVDNYSTYNGKALEMVRPWVLIKQMMHVSLYKCAPYILKPIFAYNVQILNYLVKTYPKDTAVQFDDANFYKSLIENKLTVNEEYSQAFRFYHLSGVHAEKEMNEKVEYDENATKEDTLYANFKILKTYFDYMKQLGLYEKSTIIITADHGNYFESDNLEITEPATCIMLCKPAEADHTKPVSVSQSEVCHEDVFSTILSGLNLDYSAEGRRIQDISEGEERIRTYYYSALHSDKGGEIALREYLINGDSRDFNNWNMTGRYWDIHYSWNRVSSERLDVKSSQINSTETK